MGMLESFEGFVKKMMDKYYQKKGEYEKLEEVKDGN